MGQIRGKEWALKHCQELVHSHQGQIFCKRDDARSVEHEQLRDECQSAMRQVLFKDLVTLFSHSSNSPGLELVKKMIPLFQGVS